MAAPNRERLRLILGQVRVTVDLPPGEPGRTLPVPESFGWRVLSPLTVRAVRLLCASGWLSREEIASRLGEQPDGKLGPILTDLVERQILESSTRKGYAVAWPDDRPTEQARVELLAWLDSLPSDPS